MQILEVLLGTAVGDALGLPYEDAATGSAAVKPARSPALLVWLGHEISWFGLLLDLLAAGLSPEQILEDLPDLEIDDLRGTRLRFA